MTSPRKSQKNEYSARNPAVAGPNAQPAFNARNGTTKLPNLFRNVPRNRTQAERGNARSAVRMDFPPGGRRPQSLLNGTFGLHGQEIWWLDLPGERIYTNRAELVSIQWLM